MNYIPREKIIIYLIEFFCSSTGKPLTFIGNELNYGGLFYKRVKSGGAVTEPTTQKVLNYVARALETTPEKLWESATKNLSQNEATPHE